MDDEADVAPADVLTPLPPPAVTFSRSSCADAVDADASTLVGAADRPAYGDALAGWILSSPPLGVCDGVFWWASASLPDGVDGCMLDTEAG